MRKLVIILFFVGLLVSRPASALLSLELTRGVAGAVPIAISPFGGAGASAPQDVSSIISNDLQNSGRFKVYGRNAMNQYPNTLDDIQYGYFRNLGADKLVIGRVTLVGSDRYQVNFALVDVFKGKDGAPSSQALVVQDKFVVSGSQLRPLAHHISDIIYQQILGTRGIFSTRLAYVIVQRPAGRPPLHILEVSDQDGYNPRPLLSSSDPVMSPAWSPDGKRLAYVSFENRRASIYVENIATGSRSIISQYKGINGAPAWSPDGRKLALVLSKDGSPNIYVLDVNSKQLTQLTHDWSINTEPAWSPNGKSLVFTSNRGGGPQIYQLNLATQAVSRVSYDGDYNARASFTADGSHIAMLHRENGVYNIGLLDLDTGRFHLLTNNGSDNESPSIAPNGSMVMYGTLDNGRSMLGMVSSDGKVQLRLPDRNGEVQDPAWSPFLS
ncbi:MAG: Tol-Pal system beta propeller repeat protein TolB [Gammaproteobacteria bacterium]|nr:Tol-Pal system beta propeller repeat protein TolB [Gammaproteobacteria bacterium]